MSTRRRRRRPQPTELNNRDRIDRGLLIGALILALVLGGASRGAFVAHGVLETLFAGLLAWTVLCGRDSQFTAPAWSLLAVGAVLFGVSAISLIPLPAEIWGALPGRAPISEGFGLIGGALPPLPVSLAPEATFASLTGFLPPIAAFCFAAGLLSQRAGQTIAWVLPLLATASLLIGIAQVFEGQESRLYVYEVQNRGAATGFFANVNHQATLGLMALPFLGALAGTARFRAEINQIEYGKLILIAGMMLFTITLVVFAGSVAGLLMLGPTLAASYMIAFGIGKLRSWRTTVALGVITLTAATAYIIGSNPEIQAQLGTALEDGPGSRLSATEGGGAAAWTYFPVGSGLGSFMSVFPAFERASPTSPIFMAHAHNEYLEIVIELGAVGVLILMAALVWWALQGVKAWRSEPGSDSRYRQAAWTSLGVVAVHSLVDYPLRTPGLAVTAALCAGILVAPAVYRRAQVIDDEVNSTTPKHVDL